MRGLRKSIKCMLCPHKKVCHEELDEVPRLRGIIEELKLENEEYERQIKIIQHERILLQNENARLQYNETINKITPVGSNLDKRCVLQMLNDYGRHKGCKNCIGAGECHKIEAEHCDETLYLLLEKHFNNVKYDTNVRKE